MSVISKLADLHEKYIAERLEGVFHRGSGNQWHNQSDGHVGRMTDFALRWDCKAAMPGTKSISITRDMLDKVIEQSHGETPAIPLRFYLTERGGVEFDWIAVPLEHFIGLRETAMGA